MMSSDIQDVIWYIYTKKCVCRPLYAQSLFSVLLGTVTLPSSFFGERTHNSCASSHIACSAPWSVLQGPMKEAARQKEKLFGNQQLKVIAKQSVKRGRARRDHPRTY